MTEREFVDLKINWLIQNDRIELIEDFLKRNEDFDSKSKAVQYLVDKNISSGDIKKSCEKNALYQGTSALFKVIFQKCFHTISNQHYSS